MPEQSLFPAHPGDCEAEARSSLCFAVAGMSGENGLFSCL